VNQHINSDFNLPSSIVSLKDPTSTQCHVALTISRSHPYPSLWVWCSSSGTKQLIRDFGMVDVI
jgi:hypothetical protein